MSVFATANREDLLRVREVTMGVTPASPAWIPTRMTGESLTNNISTEKSKELRSDRQVTDLIRVDSSPSGGFNFEMSAVSFEDLIEALSMGTWSAQLAISSVAGDLSTATGAGPHLTTATAGKFTNVVVGQWIRLRGFASNVDGFYQVVAKNVNNMELTLFPEPLAISTPALATGKVDGSYVRNGITERSYSMMKLFGDAIVPTRHIFRGMRVKSMNLEMSTGSILTGSFDMMGLTAEWTETALGGETFTAASSTEVLNCVTDVKNITQDGGAIGAPGQIMSLSMSVDNQHREQKGIGVLGNVGVPASQLVVNCNASQYFSSMDQALKFENAEAFAFSYRLEDKSGNAYIMTMPRCKYETFEAAGSGLDTDVMAETTFTALRDPVTNCMLQIDRFSAPV